MSITKEARSTSAHRINTAVRVALATALCVSAATGVYAADAVPADDSSASGVLAEVVVTSQRREESLSKVPISITAITQQDIDSKGIKDITDVARFTPGISVDTTGTANIAIRGIASSGGSGTTGIYIDDTPIQMRGLAFNPDEALPKAFDMERVEVLRGPQGTLFGAGSEGGTVRYITTQPSLAKTSIYSRSEVSYTTHGDPSFETGIAAGTPLIDGKLGVRATVWYRRDGGWIDRVDPTAADPQNAVVDRNANHADNVMIRLAALWAPTDNWTVTPSIFYQNRNQHDVSNYWNIYSNPSSDRYVSGNPTGRPTPDKFYLPALKLQGDFGAFQLISNTSYYHRSETSGYDGTLYNLGFYQTFAGVQVPFPLLDGTGIHLPPEIAGYRSPATVDNDQQNFTQEIRLQSSDPAARLLWTGGLFFSSNRQQYLEQIHDPQLDAFTNSVFGVGYLNEFTYTDPNGNTVSVPYDPRYPNDSYFLHTHARDKQYAAFGEATYALTDSLKVTAGIRFSRTEFSFDSETGGPQLFAPNQESNPGSKENSFTPKVNVSYQIDPGNMVYGTYAKGFRPGGGNNPLPQAACATDFQNFGITKSPDSYKSDSVHSFEVGSKNNLGGRLRLATSLYYIRWNNIQQTVVPPICQISFITNLGKALAWGGDVQVEWQATDALSAELTAGYTDARFTQDSSFGSTQGSYGSGGTTILPIVSRGNAIVGESGQPGAPVTVSVGGEYKFSLAQHDSFVRFDYEYAGRNHWTPPRQDANTAQYDAANYTLSATNFASLRAGMKVDAWSIEPFIDNLFDTHTVTNYDFTIKSGDNSRLTRQYTFRPRTYGVTALYRY